MINKGLPALPLFLVLALATLTLAASTTRYFTFGSATRQFMNSYALTFH